jgi:hypothetical protein
VARQRNWESLSPSYRERLSRNGISKAAYEAGSPVTAARGHAKTPERPERAQRDPGRYPEYIQKRATKPPGKPRKPSSAKQAQDLENARNRAFRQMIRLAYRTGYAWVNIDTIEANCFGGFTAESGAVPGMTLAEARFTATMNDDDLQILAAPQYRANPWFYH